MKEQVTDISKVLQDMIAEMRLMRETLRELQYMSELNTKQNWSDKLADLFRDAIHERNSNLSAMIPKTSWIERLDNLLKK